MLQRPQLLRTRIRAPVFLSAQAFGVKEEPIPVRRAIATFEHMMELPEAARGMVEHPVKHNTDTFLMSLFEQLSECLIPAKRAVNRVIVKSVVTMVGGGSKDRVEIQSGDP